MKTKIINAADFYKNTKFTWDHIDCFRQQCVALNRVSYNNINHSKARKYFDLKSNNLTDNAIMITKYPQFIVQQAIYHKNNHWFKMFPQKNDQRFAISNKSICNKSLIRYLTWKEYLRAIPIKYFRQFS